METFGTFEREWKRRRAMLLYEFRVQKHEEIDWDPPRRGGLASPEIGQRYRRDASRASSGMAEAFRNAGAARSMSVRFAALANGSQPAVVKLASYASGARVAAMMSYVSRNGELPVENEKGERLSGEVALSDLRAEWGPLFVNRTASRDVGKFEVKIAETSFENANERSEFIRAVLRGGFGDRRLAYAAQENTREGFEVRGVVVLRDRGGTRLSADVKAAEIVQENYRKSEIGHQAEAHFRFHSHGNGVEFATARVRELIECAKGDVEDERGRAIRTSEEAGRLVQREWRRELHSRKGRDVLHLIVSARAGTSVPAFQAAVRDFLGDQFDGNRYVFALHDPALDPKNMEQGGKRPHIHAHAIVTMLSETGQRIETSPWIFRQWRELMSQKAREHGIDMELTDRRDRASPPAYSRNQARAVSYRGRTEHEGTSPAAQLRYEAKQKDRPSIASSRNSLRYADEAMHVWSEVARLSPSPLVSEFATRMFERLQGAVLEYQKNSNFFRNREIVGNGGSIMEELSKLTTGAELISMQAMTRPAFEAYEKRVEALLADVGASIAAVERKDFDEIAAAARAVVSIRREYMQLVERRSMAEQDLPVKTANNRTATDERVDGASGPPASTAHIQDRKTAVVSSAELDTLTQNSDAHARERLSPNRDGMKDRRYGDGLATGHRKDRESGERER